MLEGVDINALFSKFNPYIKALQNLNDFIIAIGREHLQRIHEYTKSKLNPR